ncbi:hypothetical protein DSM03_101832 [Leeuwenhoekiella aestuarii]|uniref:50S ribosomal protein L27 n=1 Tax=Leeuwenhoekiella aestuarii TaxID=2249426 RepID=A0A4V1KPW9_9FLAO|nr:hypothetical protein [Leeuwenhoekiella aestuarii]RXG18152.1 hypothetical protein DSM04_101341 [Leeuwenhoekiella aestuarii]RXG19457.1 hypothetical protein DSM03_101832 [Leeuwenhoekiella aestuarii]
MYNTIQFVHSYWAYLVLIVLTITVINSLVSYFGNKEFGARDFRLALFTLIVTHIQLLIGIVLYFVSPLGAKAIASEGMSAAMSDPNLRLYVVEHPIGMILAVIFITVGYSKHKKKLTSKPKFKLLAIFYTLALACVLYMIPWSNWF